MGEKNDNWFGSWITAAKNKSCEVLEFVKKDLEEFGTVVKNEASNVVATTGNAIEKTLKLDEPESTASSMKRSISSFFGHMNESLNPRPDDSDTEEILVIDAKEGVTLTKLQQAVYELQKDEATFTQDPDPSLSKQYEYWLETIEDHQLEDIRICRFLQSSQTLKDQYIALVPLKVEHNTFWKRYLFRKALLEDDMARLESIEKRDAKIRSKLAEVTEDTVNWDEEEQIKLLEQYENETKQREEKRQKSKKEPIGEDILFQVTNTSPKKKVNRKSFNSEEIEDKKVTTSSSNSSTDGDWEKISDTDK